MENTEEKTDVDIEGLKIHTSPGEKYQEEQKETMEKEKPISKDDSSYDPSEKTLTDEMSSKNGGNSEYGIKNGGKFKKKKYKTDKFRKRCEKLPKGIGICRKCCHLRLCFCCIMMFVCGLIVSLFVVTFSVSFDSTVNGLMNVVRKGEFEKSHASIKQLFSQCEESALTVKSGIENALVDIYDDHSVGNYFHNLLKEVDSSIGSFYIGFPNGHFVYVARNGEGSGFPNKCGGAGYVSMNGSHGVQYCISQNSSAYNAYKVSGYNPTGRGWYINAMAMQNTADIVWTDIYILDSAGLSFYTVSLLVRDAAGSIVAVFAIDMTGVSISSYVHSFDVGEGGRIGILESDGTLVSVNLIDQVLLNEDLSRVPAMDADDDIVRQFGVEVRTHTDNDRSFRKTVGTKNTFMETRSFNSAYNNKNWILAMALVRSDYDRSAVISIVVLSIVVSLFVVNTICCLNCFSCCLFYRVSKLSKKMKNVSELKFHKVKVSRLHLFSELASIELSFYKMAKTILEYQAFLPDYLKDEDGDGDGEKDKKNDKFLLNANDEKISQSIMGDDTGTGTSSCASEDAYISNKKKNRFQGMEENFSDTGSEHSTTSSTCSGSITHMRIKKLKKNQKTSRFFDIRSLTIVVIRLQKGEEGGLVGEGLTMKFDVILPKLETLVSKFRGVIISFSEQEIVCGFNCKVQQNMWKSHLLHAVEFSVETKDALSDSCNLKIGICSGVSFIHTFGSQRNRIRKVVGDVEEIARNLAKMDGFGRIFICYRDACNLPKAVICKVMNVVVMSNLERRGRFFFVCEIKGIVLKERSKEWMYVREKEEISENLNLQIQCFRRILEGNVEEKIEDIAKGLNDKFLGDIIEETKKYDSVLDCLKARRTEKVDKFEEFGGVNCFLGMDFFFLF